MFDRSKFEVVGLSKVKLLKIDDVKALERPMLIVDRMNREVAVMLPYAEYTELQTRLETALTEVQRLQNQLLTGC